MQPGLMLFVSLAQRLIYQVQLLVEVPLVQPGV